MYGGGMGGMYGGGGMGGMYGGQAGPFDPNNPNQQPPQPPTSWQNFLNSVRDLETDQRQRTRDRPTDRPTVKKKLSLRFTPASLGCLSRAVGCGLGGGDRNGGPLPTRSCKV